MTPDLDTVAVTRRRKFRESYHDPAKGDCPHRKKMDREELVPIEVAESQDLTFCKWCDPTKDNGEVYNKTPRRRSLRDILADRDGPGATS